MRFIRPRVGHEKKTRPCFAFPAYDMELLVLGEIPDTPIPLFHDFQ